MGGRFLQIVGTFISHYTASHLGKSCTSSAYLVLFTTTAAATTTTTTTTATTTTTIKTTTTNHSHHHYHQSAITAASTLVANLISGNMILIKKLAVGQLKMNCLLWNQNVCDSVYTSVPCSESYELCPHLVTGHDY